jgi:hydroxymethylpyrimidine/phosphomethylpyrimidine kinase
VALTIAGSDSGAGAGLQADLKAMSALGVFATTVVTAVTAQNTAAVTAVHPVPTEVIGAQLAAVLDDFAVAAVKTGMLGAAATVRLVARRAADGDLPNLVVDPVMVASTGRRLLDDDAVGAYRSDLVPRALLVTPNLFEAAILAGVAPDGGADIDTMIGLARRVHALGPAWVLVKGGHLPGVHLPGVHLPDVHLPDVHLPDVHLPDEDGPDGGSGPDRVADVLFDGVDVHVLEGTRVITRNNHGTGCSLASATAALLARGADVPDAVAEAKRFVHDALVGASDWTLGRGHGPLDPFGWSTR